MVDRSAVSHSSLWCIQVEDLHVLYEDEGVLYNEEGVFIFFRCQGRPRRKIPDDAQTAA